MDFKSLKDSELLVEYGEWYIKHKSTSSEKNKREYLNILFNITREILKRMENENETIR